MHIAVCSLIILMVNENVPQPLPPLKKRKTTARNNKNEKKVLMVLILPNKLKGMNEGFLVFHCWLFHIRMKYE